MQIFQTQNQLNFVDQKPKNRRPRLAGFMAACLRLVKFLANSGYG